ncbi:MAG TPA: DUF6629 family protein [Gemmatimonadaceae bacterium]|nr:DUF6629 family protein [Gemmatimonadaceae bacterium]
MCFSATGSFTLSGVLAAVGVASVTRKVQAPARMFAAVPLLFAAQQVAEGVVWLTMNSARGSTPDALGAIHRLSVYAFLAFALIVWPVWSPLSLRFIERNPARKKMLTALCALGAAIGVGAAVLLSRWQPVAAVAGHSINYSWAGSRNPIVELVVLLAYASATVVAFFVSTVRYARVIGGALVVSVAMTMLIRREALTSVWCFFAAVVSCLVLVAVEGMRGPS